MEKLENDSFEIGIVMAGAVSAGAYTAGVIDYLLQALDCWYDTKLKAPSTVPFHDIKIKVIAGASAGGMTAAMMAAELHRRATGIYRKEDPTVGYKSWVEDIDISFLLEDNDLKNEKEIKSILDSSQIDKIADGVLGNLTTQHWDTSRIPYADDRVKLYLTLSNLRGLPYSFSMAGESNFNFGMMNHADYQYVEIGPETKKENWEALREAAKATGAFPVGLASRVIKRSTTEYALRISYDGSDLSRFLEMSVDDIPYSFVAVDGGTLNNEPIELAEAALIRVKKPKAVVPDEHELKAVIESRNKIHEKSLKIIEKEIQSLESKGDTKEDIEKEIITLQKEIMEENLSAIIMIDPFPNVNPKTTDATEEDSFLIRVLGKILGALRDQSLFRPHQLLLSSSNKMPNRFLIAPVRYQDGVRVLNAIASGFMEGFGGFFSRAFREHDYQLGRRNCQKFLKDHLVLPWEIASGIQALKPDEKFIIEKEGKKFYPLIPLMTEMNSKSEDQMSWPKFSVIETKQLQRKIRFRVRALLNAALPFMRKYNLALYVIGALSLMAFILLERYSPTTYSLIILLAKITSLIFSFISTSLLLLRFAAQAWLSRKAYQLAIAAMTDYKIKVDSK